jgi:thioredoxin reductase (NADPH)
MPFSWQDFEKVYVVHRRNQFRAKKDLAAKLVSMENVTVLWDSVVEKIQGDRVVDSILVKNVKTNEGGFLAVSGIFVAVGYSPNSEVYKDVVATDAYGYIIAGEDCSTNIPGIFAAGDIRTKQLRQIITAASDGAVAATAAEKYLNC